MAKTYKTVRDMVHDIGDPEFVEFYDAMNECKELRAGSLLYP